MKIGTIYRHFHFLDKDPAIDALRTIVRNNEHLTNGAAAAITGVSATTFHNWFEGPTRRPSNATATQVAAALGCVRRDELTKTGQVIVGYVKVRDLDLKKEREKMADWLLKQHGPKKKKRRKKANGHG